jgi:hypothetical protein
LFYCIICSVTYAKCVFIFTFATPVILRAVCETNEVAESISPKAADAQSASSQAVLIRNPVFVFLGANPRQASPATPFYKGGWILRFRDQRSGIRCHTRDAALGVSHRLSYKKPSGSPCGFLLTSTGKK